MWFWNFAAIFTRSLIGSKLTLYFNLSPLRSFRICPSEFCTTDESQTIKLQKSYAQWVSILQSYYFYFSQAYPFLSTCPFHLISLHVCILITTRINNTVIINNSVVFYPCTFYLLVAWGGLISIYITYLVIKFNNHPSYLIILNTTLKLIYLFKQRIF